jgi:hypothetical protein
MAYFTGQVQAKDLFSTILTKITQVQAGETESWWKKESSLDADGVYTSKGSSGNERIVLVFREGTAGLSFLYGVARDYTPGAVNTAGAFDNLVTGNLEYYTSTQDQTTMVTYDISVTRDRVIIHVQGDKLISSYANSVAFLGMPLRYDINDKKCIVYAASEDAVVNGSPRVLEDSIGNVHQNYNWYYIASPGNPSWGNNFFVETLHFGKGSEGLRGELDGLYTTHPSGLIDGDVIDVNGTQFKVIKRVSNGSTAFPRDCMLMRLN